jgi:branched-chain amino acid transport system substrate-binding protein
MSIPVTGPLAESGRYAMQGARLAIAEISASGGALGRPLELVVEDDQSTNPGTVLAFSKLAGNADIPILLGPTRSTQIQAIAPDILKTGKPVLIGGTDPRLTKAGNPWLFRFRPNDTYTARVIADFGANILGRKKWAIVFATDAFGTSASGLLTEALSRLGIAPLVSLGSPNNSADFTPVALAVRQSGADVMATFITFENDLAIFARQLKQQGVSPVWVGSPSTVTTTALNLAGPALFGSYAVADFHPDANALSKSFAASYVAAYKSPARFFCLLAL